MKTDELIIFRKLTQYDILRKTARFIFAPDGGSDLYGCVYALLEFAATHGFQGNLWQAYLTERIVNDENAFSLSCERTGVAGKTLTEAARRDMELILEWFSFDWEDAARRLDMAELRQIALYEGDEGVSRVYNRGIRDAIATLCKRLAAAKDADEATMRLTEFYQTYGVGSLGLHKAFRVNEAGAGPLIAPIRNIRHVRLDDLVGYETAKHKLVENTEAFLAGKSANNCLLYGDAGTGKSTSVKAIANVYFDKGLRVIELYKHQAGYLHDVIDQIKNRNYRFIVYMDDLSFEDFETEYKYLKAVIEGGLEKKPENVLIYATSNRRHLIRESFKDKPALLDDDVHRGDTVQEKLSLAYRFGVHIYFGAPNKDDYEEIVRVLAKRAGLAYGDDELIKEATRWEMTHGGKSGRTATQFVDHLAGRKR